jgi:hypothetical protein
MRQKSTTGAQLARECDLRLHGRPAARLAHDPSPGASDLRARRPGRRATAAADRRQARRQPAGAPASSFPPAPAPRAPLRHAQLLGGRLGRREQLDLCAPPLPALVALGLMRDHAGGLEVIQPALHALAMCAHEPCALRQLAWDAAPAHHRCQPHDELLDRAREPPRPRRVPEPEQVALDRVRPRLDPIITRRDAPAGAPGAAQQRAHHQPAGLRWQRRVRRPIPTARRPAAVMRGCAFQRHRERPTTPHACETQHLRADARGAAGQAPSSREQGSVSARRPHPSRRGWRSVRRPATVGEERICGCSSRSTSWLEDRSGKTGQAPGLLRSCGRARGGPRQDGLDGRALARGNVPRVLESEPPTPESQHQAPRGELSAPPRRLSAPDEEHCSSDREQRAPHLLPMRPSSPATRVVSVRASSHPEREKAAAQPANSQFCAAALTSGDGGNRTHVRNRMKGGVYERSRRSISRPPLADAGRVVEWPARLFVPPVGAGRPRGG